MTGEDVKQKAIVTLRSHVWNMPSPEAAEEACAEALAALEPCIVLTAEEAVLVADQLWACLNDHPDDYVEEIPQRLALLTPTQPDEVIPGYGSSI